MARKLSITFEDFTQAIEELEIQGLNSTMDAIRKKIGGSYSTIGPFMREYRKQKGDSRGESISPPPEAISNKLSRFANEMWASAMEEANIRLKGERDAMEIAMTNESRDRNEALAIADQLAENSEEQNERIVQLQAALDASLLSAADLLRKLAYEQERTQITSDEVQVLKEELLLARQEQEAAREEAARLAGKLEVSHSLWTQFGKEEVATATRSPS